MFSLSFVALLSFGLAASATPVTPETQPEIRSELAARADDSYRSIATANNPDWMAGHSDSTSLARLSIPGTHESMAIVGGDITECQENYGDSGNTLTAQLNAGIRAFDIRLRVETRNTFTIHHGAKYQNANFDNVIDKFAEFLIAHPSETIIMRAKQECTGQIGSCTDLGGQAPFTDIFDMYMNNSPMARRVFWGPSINRNSAAGVPNLGDVRGKVVLLVLHNANGARTNQYGLAQFSGWNDGNSQFVQDNYNGTPLSFNFETTTNAFIVPNVNAIATKRDQFRRFLDSYNTGSADFNSLFINFSSGSSLFALPYQVAAGAWGVQGLNDFILGYLRQGPEVHQPVRRVGVALMDFPGGVLINKILEFNNGL